ncbi:DUF998 domain-containing protein [Angustibacter sp. McL0619]|uniref:DUF998 domain-containing protein n=1 Tax=Angustibacter sp. McL0619 TaxID=3415676 RepID=UPI003CEB9AC2
MTFQLPDLARPLPERTAARPTSALAVTAVLGLGGFAVAVAVTGMITPRYDARREAISGLAALDSPYAWIMILGFLSGATALVCAALLLWTRVPARAGRLAAGLVGISGLLMAVAGLARQDCSDQLATCKDFGDAVNASGSYWIHEYASLVGFLLLIISFFLLARGLSRTSRLGLAVASRIIGTLCLAGTALLVVTPPSVVDNYGIVQRLLVALLFGWPVAAGVLAAHRTPPS